MAESRERDRLAAWADSQGVDLNAKLVFLSLPSNISEAIRDLGQLKSARIWAQVGRAYVLHCLRDHGDVALSHAL